MSVERFDLPASDAPFKFGTPVSELYRDPAGYDPSPELRAAIRVALLLGMPLLLTGEPGCGKTSVGHWLAWKLQLGDALVHNVKSASTGRELLYDFDELGRFRDIHGGTKRENSYYVRLNALGLAILFSAKGTTPLGYESFKYENLAGPAQGGADADRFARRHVVLIDELDKAPRDTPNDLLLELEQMRFRIGELDTWVEGAPEHRPIVVITSNSEKSLPEPFLRRCVFHHIKSPDDARRREIVARRRHPFVRREAAFEEAMRLFERLHSSLGRPPGTAELLAWLTALEDEAKRAELRQPANTPVTSLKGLFEPSLGTLANRWAADS